MQVYQSSRSEWNSYWKQRVHRIVLTSIQSTAGIYINSPETVDGSIQVNTLLPVFPLILHGVLTPCLSTENTVTYVYQSTVKFSSPNMMQHMPLSAIIRVCGMSTSMNLMLHCCTDKSTKYSGWISVWR